VLDDAAFGAATDVTPKFVAPADPAARLDAVPKSRPGTCRDRFTKAPEIWHAKSRDRRAGASRDGCVRRSRCYLPISNAFSSSAQTKRTERRTRWVPSRYAATAVSGKCRYRSDRRGDGDSQHDAEGRRGADQEGDRGAVTKAHQARREAGRRQHQSIFELYELPDTIGVNNFKARQPCGPVVQVNFPRLADHVIQAVKRNIHDIVARVVSDAKQRQPAILPASGRPNRARQPRLLPPWPREAWR
jgi:hypothetical protein